MPDTAEEIVVQDPELEEQAVEEVEGEEVEQVERKKKHFLLKR